MMTEFGLIAQAAALCQKSTSNGFEGIGDDCAILPVGNGEALVYTADLLVEGVHFLRHAATPEEIAHKALHVNLSDVAAMGVRPVATLLSVALPRETMTGDWAERFMQGYIAASNEASVALVGGDTTASQRDIVINVTAIGRGPEAHLKRRSGAEIGDWICVGAPLGASGAGLRDILAGNHDTPAARIHKRPQAQIEEGVWLGSRREVHAMMDISDGIASDLKHLFDRSHCGAEVELTQLPIAPGADEELALTAGEEYSLLFTVEAAALEQLRSDYQKQFGTPPHPVGRIVPRTEKPLRWLRNGVEIEGTWQGFRHY